MLAKDSFDDIKAVIDAVRECPEKVDQARYRNAYDLNRPGEWEILQGLVAIHKLVKAKQAAHPQVVPAPKADDDDWLDEDDDDWRPLCPTSSRNDPWDCEYLREYVEQHRQ
jgi:hypothetical protein